MNGISRGVVWFSRVLLTAAAFIMVMIAFRNLRDPIGATQPIGIVLASPTGMTVVRVGFGGFPLGFAVALIACMISTERLLSGLYLLAAVIGAATFARIQGLVLDGVTSYNVGLLRPEIVLCVLSIVGIVLERRRRHEGRDVTGRGRSLQASVVHGGR
jgi:fucose permease